MPTMESKRFTGVRVVVTTAMPFDEVLDALTGLLGNAPFEQLGALVRASSSREVFEREVERRFVGESGFMKFGEIDHGSWLGMYGIHRRSVRWIFGNPLIAVTMIRHDMSAGLFVPVEMLITEAEDGAGATLTYLLPSSLMVIEDNPPLRAAAEALDKKVAALVERAAR
jgi:uncharacterized protein (DUF302 family)